MTEEKIHRPYIPEFIHPGAHPGKGPVQGTVGACGAESKLQQILQKLAKIAEAGDLVGWKRTLPEIDAAAAEERVDLSKDLGTRVILKQCELTLFIQASKVARNQARYAETRANDAQIEDRSDQARALFQHAQKFNELADYLTQQLKGKTS